MTKMDMKDAYLCLRIADEHMKLYWFRWNNALFHFCVCPFGLVSGLFINILKAIRLLIYEDELIILNQNPANLIVDSNSIIWILQPLVLW